MEINFKTIKSNQCHSQGNFSLHVLRGTCELALLVTLTSYRIYPTFYCSNNILRHTNYETPHYENFQLLVYPSYSRQHFIVIKIGGKNIYIHFNIIFAFHTVDARRVSGVKRNQHRKYTLNISTRRIFGTKYVVP